MSELREEEELREGFRLGDDQQADWALRKIAEADQELDRMTGWYQRQIELAQQKHEEQVRYFTGLLQEYFWQVPVKETKTMSKYELPSGKLVLNKAKDDYKAVDNEALLSWCMTNEPDLVKITTAPKWAEIKKRLVTQDGKAVDKETGMFVAGVEIEEKPAEFKVKVGA